VFAHLIEQSIANDETENVSQRLGVQLRGTKPGPASELAQFRAQAALRKLGVLP
jgi:hypothetical protein